MKTICRLYWFALFGVACTAGDFVNLDFNSPDLSKRTYFMEGAFVPVNDAFTGWTISDASVWFWSEKAPAWTLIGPSKVGQWTTDVRSHGGLTAANLLAPEAEPQNYVLDILNVVPYYAVPRGTFTLSQDARIPAWANLLAFEEYDGWGEGGGRSRPAEIYLDGVLAEHLPEGGAQGELWAVDVTKYAGRDVELKIVFPMGQGYDFDIKGFVPIPEPSTWALLGLGTLCLLSTSRAPARCGSVPGRQYGGEEPSHVALSARCCRPRS